MTLPNWLAHTRLLRRVMTWFPERQIYIRSEGRVRFYKVGRGLQAIVAGISAIFLAWVALSSVIVVFKDRIITAEDHRYVRAQAAFESKIAALRISYDDLVAKATNAQTCADGQVLRLERREQFFTRTTASHNIKGMSNAVAAVDTSVGKHLGPHVPIGIFGRTFHWLGLGGARGRARTRHPSMDRLAADTTALVRLSYDSNAIMAAIEGGILRSVVDEKQRIAGTGIDADQFLHKLESVAAVGGPEISLDTMQLDGISDRDFSQAYFRAEADLGELSELRRAVLRLPTATPLGSKIERTSGFGPRLDPFSGRYAFHPGIDFAGPTGTAVQATADGLVSFAGSDGGYGNMVEIDHGYGLKTRYAHLLSVGVTKGQRIVKGMMVGRLGSTGRSTGPHVHYEVWYDEKVRNPDGFLRLGTLAGNDNCKVIACSFQRR
jgi:murein DD-endopeptidase MepM/ murein hydrolase activator NlpD